ncbi:MAG TPA: molybdopterin molybdotransferase MoeA, partial [Candidatus Ozemobacteraceae bacterium]|nr:molybdopterin molybdotransferase MoeA [Candidatus Ozemobacteraceae bacterium]
IIPPTNYARHTNIRPLGEDVHAGSPLLEGGTRLDAVALARLASAGITRFLVRRQPRILILTSGNELRRPGCLVPALDRKAAPSNPACPKFECDSTLLRALLAEEGFSARVLPHLPDRRDRFLQTLRGLKPFDLLLTCGGAANSEADHVRPALRELGAEFLFERVRVKPARPTALAHWRRGLVFCLPGNPVAVFAAFHAFVLPTLRAAHGHPDPAGPRFYARLDHDFTSDPRRHLLSRVRVKRTPEGVVASPHPESGSALLRTLIDSNGLAIIEPGDIIPRGTPVPVIWSRSP